MNELLEKTGIPFTFWAFPTESEEYTPPKPPFITYIFGDTSNFFADGIVYMEVVEIMIELYTDKYSPDAEAKVENTLREAEIAWEKERNWLSGEKMYQTVYRFQLEQKEEENEERE